jgi:hypothetical protein
MEMNQLTASERSRAKYKRLCNLEDEVNRVFEYQNRFVCHFQLLVGWSANGFRHKTDGKVIEFLRKSYPQLSLFNRTQMRGWMRDNAAGAEKQRSYYKIWLRERLADRNTYERAYAEEKRKVSEGDRLCPAKYMGMTGREVFSYVVSESAKFRAKSEGDKIIARCVPASFAYSYLLCLLVFPPHFASAFRRLTMSLSLALSICVCVCVCRYTDDPVYRDPDFPKPEGSDWRHLHQMLPDSRLFVSGISPDDVCQGRLDDDWFLAALGVMAIEPDRIENLCVSKNKYKMIGLYEFRFWSTKEGRWQDVMCDDMVPWYRGKPMFGHNKDIKETWVAMIEKAYVVIYIPPQRPPH